MNITFTADELLATMLDYRALATNNSDEWRMLVSHMGHDIISPFDTAKNVSQLLAFYTETPINEFEKYLNTEQAFIHAFNDLRRVAPVDDMPSIPDASIEQVTNNYFHQLESIIDAAPKKVIDELQNATNEEQRFLKEFNYFHNRFIARNNNYFSPDGAYRTNDIASAISQYIQDEAPDLEKFNIHLKADVEPHLFEKNPTLFVIDPLVQNAVTHAFKHKSPPHHITIEGKLGEAGNYLCTVKDNGDGIPKDKLDYMFVKNVSSRNKQQNVHGQGLLNVGRFIERYNGTIQAGNHDEGAYITFVLPKQ